MDSILQDLRYAARRLLRAPSFTITAVLTLAIGIGAVTSVFSLVDGVLLRSLPFPDADRLMWVEDGGTSPLGLYEIASGDRGVIEAAAADSRNPRVLSGLGPAAWVNANTVTAGFFPLLGARPYVGRLLLPEEDRVGSAPVVVLSYAFWTRRFGGDPAVLGRTLQLDSTDYRIIGVTFPDFRYPAGVDMWCNLGPRISGTAGAKLAAEHVWWILARLRPGVAPPRAKSELQAAVRTSGSAYPTVQSEMIGVSPLQAWLVEDVRTGLLILLGAVALLLLTAATNVASLLVSRVTDRDRELSVRTAFGAGRGRLALLVFTESLLVAVAGGFCGVLLADLSLGTLVRFLGSDLPKILDIRVDPTVLAFAAGLSVVAGLVAGFIPALQAGRRDPIEGIKGYGRHGAKVVKRPGDTLVVTQVALTVVLLSGAGLLGDSFWRLIRLDPGFQSSNVVVASTFLPDLRYPTPQSRGNYAARALETARAIPGVLSAAVSTGVPLEGGELNFGVKNPARPDAHAVTWVAEATPDFLQTFGIPLKRGRWADDPTSMVIDEATARIFFAGDDPLGKVLPIEGRPDRTIVGIVGDTRQESLNQDPPPHVYLPLGQAAPDYLKVIIRTSGPAASMVSPLRTTLQKLDANAPINRVEPVSDAMATSLATERSYAAALGVFAFAALALAAIGIYGLVATGVARRTREIGIRIALGAERENVIGLVLRRGVVLAGLGLVIGLGGSVLGTRVLKSMLFQVRAGDPVVLGAVAVALFAATLAATYFPARRAAGVDPLVALRTD